jgi:hypothetical protein
VNASNHTTVSEFILLYQLQICRHFAISRTGDVRIRQGEIDDIVNTRSITRLKILSSSCPWPE